MLVKNLIKLLEKEDPDAVVICQGDSEGNYYSPLSDIEGERCGFGYLPDTTWSGERVIRKLTKMLKDDGYTKEDVDKRAAKAVFLIPVN